MRRGNPPALYARYLSCECSFLVDLLRLRGLAGTKRFCTWGSPRNPQALEMWDMMKVLRKATVVPSERSSWLTKHRVASEASALTRSWKRPKRYWVAYSLQRKTASVHLLLGIGGYTWQWSVKICG